MVRSIDNLKEEMAELDKLIELLDPANPIEGQQLDVALTRMETLEAELTHMIDYLHRAKFVLIKGGKE